MGNHLEILRWRHTTALGPGRPFFETEVTDGKKKYYVSLSVNFCGEKESVLEDGHWEYVCPLDKVDFADDGRGQMVEDVDFSDVLKVMVRKWNRRPAFCEDGWHDWKTTRRLIRFIEADVDGCGSDADLLFLVEGQTRVRETVIDEIRKATAEYKEEHRSEGWDSDELFDIAAGILRDHGYNVSPLPLVRDVYL